MQVLLSISITVEASGYTLIKMDFIPKDRILEFKPDTLEFIRKQYNLDKPGQMKEAINILRDWVQKQNHFKKKDFSEHYYEVTIIACKGSIERAKRQIDKICTMRTLLPQFFGNYNIKTDFGNLNDIVYTFMLPKLTDDHYRIEIVKFYDVDVDASRQTDYYKSTIVFSEYVRAHDYMNGVITILDYSDANLMDHMTKINIVEFRKVFTVYIEGYGMRLKGVHIITTSKFLDKLLMILKQILSPKIIGRVHIHKTVDEIHPYIPKSILPKDYGGEERSLKELQTEWIEVLSSEEHLKFMREINEAGTDESKRQADKFNEQYAGMPGTFRLLSVD